MPRWSNLCKVTKKNTNKTHQNIFYKKITTQISLIRNKSLSLHPQPHSEGVIYLFAAIAQLVEHDLAKVGVASSSLVCRSLNGFLMPQWWNW